MYFLKYQQNKKDKLFTYPNIDLSIVYILFTFC